MIERMIIDVGIDRRRVFVVGLSAGGAMASAMLAVYPDVFAGGAIIAGLPFASATNVQEAFEVMAKGRERAGPQWGDRVRSASTHRGSWPKLSVWHGTADGIVNARNMEDILKQWADVHDVSLRPSLEHKIGGHTRRVWRTDADVDVMEAISLTGMGHGVPLATGDGPGRCGNAAPSISTLAPPRVIISRDFGVSRNDNPSLMIVPPSPDRRFPFRPCAHPKSQRLPLERPPLGIRWTVTKRALSHFLTRGRRSRRR
jgi:poly(3-hydroxybutyrate) depolymerase